MAIYEIKEATDQEGKYPFKTIGFVKAKSEEAARKKANKNDIHVEDNGFFQVIELSKEEGKKVVKKLKKQSLKAKVAHDAALVLSEMNANDNGIDGKKYTKETDKLYDKTLKTYRKVEELLELVS
jgi:hypothetical protein